MAAAGLKGDDEAALKGLLEAFGPTFSLDQIASAYCKAGKNADDAAEALAMSAPLSNADGAAEVKKEESLRVAVSDSNMSEKSYESNGTGNWNNGYNGNNGNGNGRGSRQKYRPVSVGSVSSIIGKDYVRKTPANAGANDGGNCEATKPIKLDSNVLPMSEIWVEKEESFSRNDDRLHQDMENFLFSMLGDGFKLERERIRQVLDSCGYDMEKSMEKLINLPPATSDKRNEVISKSSEKSAGLCLMSEVSSEMKCKNSTEGNRDRDSTTNGIELTGQQKKRNDLQKEVLSALFSDSERHEERTEELPRRSRKTGNTFRAYGIPVVEPPKDYLSEYKSAVVYQQNHVEDDADDEDSYQVLRKAVKEYRTTMKEYYQAAFDAFAQQDYDRSNKLMEQGHFFLNKSREAEEESHKMILKTRNAETEGEIVLDLTERGAKESIRLLKCQISSFAGIASIKYLKVIIDTSEEDISKGSRRRVLVLKLLEEESIKWTEGENAGTILIRIDNVNQKKLSYMKK